MDVLLLNAPVTVRNEHARLTPPLGLAYIAAALDERGFSVGAVDLNVSGLNLRRIDAILEYDRPAIVGISAMTETYTNALAIARRVKETAHDTKVVLGGAHPTILPAAVAAEHDVDFVVVGAGERSMSDLAQMLLLGQGVPEDIAGLTWKDAAGGIHVNAQADLPAPDDLPAPARHLFPTDFYRDKWNVLTATGSCPYRCPFCSAASIWQGKRRLRSPQGVVDEVRQLIEEYDADGFFFTDDIFTLDARWVRRLAEEIRTLPRPITWGCATRVDLVDGELLSVMAEAGCRGIQFGVESGSQRILDSVKHIKKEEVLRAVEWAVGLGIDAVSSFIVPLPDDTKETLAQTRAFMREVHAAGSRILLSYTCPFPGTAFHRDADDLGLQILSDDWSEYDAKHVTMATRHLSREEIEEAVEAMAADLGLQRSVA